MKVHPVFAMILLAYSVIAILACIPLAVITSPAMVVLVAVTAPLAEILAIVCLRLEAIRRN